MSFTLEQRMVLMHCANCGVPFAVTTDLEQRRRNDHADFWCPNGHTNVFKGETDAERLARQLKYAQGSRDDYRDRLDRKTRQHNAAKGQITKLRNKINRDEADEVPS